eukprot:9803009-Karenia_brevis.AAC.1
MSCTYNVMTLRSPGRLEACLTELKQTDDICFIGTRVPKGSQAIEKQMLMDTFVFMLATRKDRIHTGASLCFKMATT